MKHLFFGGIHPKYNKEMSKTIPTVKVIEPKTVVIPMVQHIDDALEMILNVPRVFLPLVLKGCVDWAPENDCTLITAAEMKIINDKRAKEKNKK